MLFFTENATEFIDLWGFHRLLWRGLEERPMERRGLKMGEWILQDGQTPD